MSDVGLRERKKVETRRAIATAALELALTHGPHDLTVEEIASAAGVSPRTVFNYFGTKDEAILGIDPESRAATAERLRARPPGEPPLEALRAVLKDRITTVDETGRYWRIRADLVRRFPQLRSAHIASQSALEAELAAVIGERTGLDPAADIYPALVVGVALCALRLVLSRPATGEADQLAMDIDSAFRELSAGLPVAARAVA